MVHLTAASFLRAQLANGEWVPKTDIMKAAREDGFTEASMVKAKTNLRVHTSGWRSPVCWRLEPAPEPKPVVDPKIRAANKAVAALARACRRSGGKQAEYVLTEVCTRLLAQLEHEVDRDVLISMLANWLRMLDLSVKMDFARHDSHLLRDVDYDRSMTNMVEER